MPSTVASFRGLEAKLMSVPSASVFFGDDLEPETVTGLMGVPPTDCGRQGAARSGGRSGVNRRGYWLLNCERTTDTADHQIKLLLNIDLPQELSIWRSLAASFKAELLVNLFPIQWQRDTTFSVEVLQLLAERELRLQVDIYSKRPPLK
jgi:hypothetical protein